MPRNQTIKLHSNSSNQPQTNQSDDTQNQAVQDSQLPAENTPLTQDVKNIIAASPLAKQIKRNPVYAVFGIIVGIALIVTGTLQLRSITRKSTVIKPLSQLGH